MADTKPASKVKEQRSPRKKAAKPASPMPPNPPDTDDRRTASPTPLAGGTLRVDSDRIAILTFDQPNSKVNTLSRATLAWAEQVMGELEQHKDLAGLVLASAKPTNFIAGANIEDLRTFDDRQQILDLIHAANQWLDRLEGLSLPVVAAIHGSCLGGGLEVALACHGRIATSHEDTKLGLPEVQLGLFPAAGGTYRLPRVIGLEKAIELIVTGKQLDARRALRMGLVDEVVHPADLMAAARAWVKRRAAAARRALFSFASLGELLPTVDELKDKAMETGPLRLYVFKKAREEVRKNAGDHYPAPYVALDMIEKGLGLAREESFHAVEQAFADLVFTDVAQNLMNLFFLRQGALRTTGGVKEDVKQREVSRLGILGAGFMGAGVAQLAAYRGCTVRLKDVDMKAVGRGLRYGRERFDELVQRKRLTRVERDLYLGNLSGGADYAGFRAAQFVIEAVFEDLELKRRVLREVEAVLRPDATFASNTSSLPIGQLAEASQRPETVVGMHFFSPVHKMPLLEIIRAPRTGDQAVADTLGLARRLGKVPIVVRDCTGFFTTRVLGPYVNEAAYLVQEGGDIAEIDAAMKDFGFPVGPVTLMDEVGLDVGAKVAEVLHRAYGERMKPPASLERVLADGRQGRKNRRGFYRYEGDAKRGVDPTVYALLPGGARRRSIPAAEIQDRCWMALLNECARCLQEGIVPDPETVDVGVIFGFGFPPFRGGVFRHADRVGARTLVARLREFEERFGARFEPAQILLDLDKSRGRLYR